MRRARTITDSDLAVWTAYLRTVRPLPGHAAPAMPPSLATSSTAPPPAAPPPQALPAAPRPRAQPAALQTGLQPAGLDNGTWNRFRTGRLAPVRTLDLHGRTVHAAYHALVHFLHTAHRDGVRCVEVITGRGSPEHGGAIRRELPLWLNLPSVRPLVLAAAHPHARNEGSTRLLLRKRG